jgi:acyl-CoA hydrolase
MRFVQPVSEEELQARPQDVQLDEWVAPELVDAGGLLQAGKLLEWLDTMGSLAATRHCRRPVVTVGVDGMELHEPIRLGDRVRVVARVAHTSTHAAGVSIAMTHGKAPVEAYRPTLEAYLTFVPTDRRGRPQLVRRFSPETPAELVRHREGELRRDFRRRLEEERQRNATGATLHHPRMPWAEVEDRPSRLRNRSYIHRIQPVPSAAVNSHGVLFGGALMRLAEQSASLSARTYLDGAAVRCVGIHGLSFLRPVERDRFLHLRSVVIHTARTAVTSLVSVQSEDGPKQAQTENLRAFITYVPLDSSVRVPPVESPGPEERALFAEMEQRLALQRRIGEEAHAA